MPKAVITARFLKHRDLAKNDYAGVKKSQREDIKRQYPGATILSQQLITDGIPDAIKLGELKANGEVAIRTEFTINDKQAAELKAKLR